MATVVDNVRLPLDIEEGASMGPTFSTAVIPLSGGAEQRNANWDQERFAANVAYGVMAKDSPEDQEDGWRRIADFFRARRGRARGFLFRDWTDYQAEFEPLYRTADGSYKTFQLSKRYDNYLRRITRPNVQTIGLYYNGAEIPPAGGEAAGMVFPAWTTLGLGIITFDVALSAVVANNLTASFEFDIPVRFDTDTFQVSLMQAQVGSIPSLDVIQVFE